MKKLIIIMAASACMAPFAFGQQSTAKTEQSGSESAKTEMAKSAIEATVTTFTPGEKLVVRRAGEASTTFTVSKTLRVENKKGEEIGVTRLKEGARVHIYASGPQDNRVVDRVVLDEE